MKLNTTILWFWYLPVMVTFSYLLISSVVEGHILRIFISAMFVIFPSLSFVKLMKREWEKEKAKKEEMGIPS